MRIPFSTQSRYVTNHWHLYVTNDYIFVCTVILLLLTVGLNLVKANISWNTTFTTMVIFGQISIGTMDQFLSITYHFRGTMIRQKAPPIRRPCPPPEGLFCMYPHRTCMQNRLEGYEYCARHILEDKNSVYKQGNYISGKSGKRCPCAAPKSDKKEG